MRSPAGGEICAHGPPGPSRRRWWPGAGSRLPGLQGNGAITYFTVLADPAESWPLRIQRDVTPQEVTRRSPQIGPLTTTSDPRMCEWFPFPAMPPYEARP